VSDTLNPYAPTARHREQANKWHATFVEGGFSGTPGDLAFFLAGVAYGRALSRPYDGPKLGQRIGEIHLEEVPECSQVTS
jgi:hypothetical protein